MLKTDTLKRTEKLASAAYLVTGYFDDKEPLKWQVRTLAGQLVSASLEVSDNPSLRDEKTLSHIRSCMLELSALFTVAKNAGLVSAMNYEILSREFEKFLSESTGEPQALTDEFFAIPKQIAPAASPAELKDKTAELSAQAVPTVEDKFKNEYLPGVRIMQTGPVSIKDEMTPLTPRRTQPQKEKSLREFGAVAVKKNSRQSIIINLLKRKKEIMIKDVSPLISGVSEKTIQRELLAMVGEGILKKEGEKRWSRYTLA